MQDNNSPTTNFKAHLEALDSNQQAEIAAQLFLEYCVYQDQCENTKRLAPLINTVAEALTKNIGDKGALMLGIRAVQMYLRTPPVEYFGEALSRLGFLEMETVEEMVRVQPKNKILGSFLMDQGLITQENRDIAVMAQKRLFTIHEVYERLLSQGDNQGEKTDLVESLKGVLQHFLVCTNEIEEDLKDSCPENIHFTLERLENIITETEKQSHLILELVEKVFSLIEEMAELTKGMKKHITPSDKIAMEYIAGMVLKLERLNTLNLEFNSSQQIQDRIGQQIIKIIPSIQIFHDQLLKIAKKMDLNWEKTKSEETALTHVGYGGTGPNDRVDQNDVDDLLSSLGL